MAQISNKCQGSRFYERVIPNNSKSLKEGKGPGICVLVLHHCLRQYASTRTWLWGQEYGKLGDRTAVPWSCPLIEPMQWDSHKLGVCSLPAYRDTLYNNIATLQVLFYGHHLKTTATPLLFFPFHFLPVPHSGIIFLWWGSALCFDLFIIT